MIDLERIKRTQLSRKPTLLRRHVRDLIEQVERLRKALDDITRIEGGGYETAFGDIEPCERCGDMRTIADQALERN